MCNGYNHAADCDCGWGGVYHGGSGSGIYGAWDSVWLSDMRDGFAPFPNCMRALAARYRQEITLPRSCRYCGQDVYIYSNEHGSFVIFDQLGWPWPKHICPNAPLYIKEQIAKDNYDLFFPEAFNLYNLEQNLRMIGQIKGLRQRKVLLYKSKTIYEKELSLVQAAKQIIKFGYCNNLVLTVECRKCGQSVYLLIDNHSQMLVDSPWNLEQHKCPGGIYRMLDANTSIIALEDRLRGTNLPRIRAKSGETYEGLVCTDPGSSFSLNLGSCVIPDLVSKEALELYDFVRVDIDTLNPRLVKRTRKFVPKVNFSSNSTVERKIKTSNKSKIPDIQIQTSVSALVRHIESMITAEEKAKWDSMVEKYGPTFYYSAQRETLDYFYEKWIVLGGSSLESGKVSRFARRVATCVVDDLRKRKII